MQLALHDVARKNIRNSIPICSSYFVYLPVLTYVGMGLWTGRQRRDPADALTEPSLSSPTSISHPPEFLSCPAREPRSPGM